MTRVAPAADTSAARALLIDPPREERFDMATWGEGARLRLGTAAGAGLAVLDFVAPAGFGPPRHVHHEDDEVLLLQQGTLALWTPSACGVAHAGDLVLLPRGVPHAWRAVGETPIRAVALATPGRLEFTFREIVERRLTVADQAGLAAVAVAAGVDVTGAPLSDEDVATILAGGHV